MTYQLLIPLGRSATIVALMSGLVLPASATHSANDPIPKPTKKAPQVKTTPNREGVQLKGTTGNRLETRDHNAGTKRPAGHESAKNSVNRRKQRRERTPQATIDEIKLNVGICGTVGADGTFPGPTRCQPFVGDPPGRRPEVEPTGGIAVQVPRAQDVRWEAILNAYKNVLFAALKVKVQPEGRTLVRWETNVYTEQARVTTKTVELLGFPVVVEATPVSYSWDFGDGKKVTTASPGRPYPGKDVTHKYLKRGDVGVFVTTNYAARFNVDGTGWQYVEGTVGIAGPATGLLVREGVPVLVDPPG